MTAEVVAADGGNARSMTTTHISRRGLLRAGAAALTASAVLSPTRASGAGVDPMGALADRIRAGMRRYAIPGVAVGIRYRGAEHIQGFGVTNVDDPRPVDGDTVFRVGSTTKTVTGTAVMRLVDRGAVDLDARVRRYLPDLKTADPSVADRVTVRQLLDHSAGWLGDHLLDTGSDRDALARYVATLDRLPQLTAPGTVFSYNNAAISLAGRIVEVVTGRPYEDAVADLVTGPLHMSRSRFVAGGGDVAMAHNVVDGRAVAVPAFLRMPRSVHPAGGLYSSVRDQLRYARFHLGDGRSPDGVRLLSRRSLHAMRSRPGPGGIMFVELDGMGVTWRLRPTAEGVRVVEHGGSWGGQHSGFLLVPDRDFAFTLLTNSEGGPALVAELFHDDWALRTFTGLHNLPATPRPVPDGVLAGYAGRYVLDRIEQDGSEQRQVVEAVADAGRLALREHGVAVGALAFYGRDRAIMLDAAGAPDHTRADLIRDRRGRVRWLRIGGRLLRHTDPAGPAGR